MDSKKRLNEINENNHRRILLDPLVNEPSTSMVSSPSHRKRKIVKLMRRSSQLNQDFNRINEDKEIASLEFQTVHNDVNNSFTVASPLTSKKPIDDGSNSLSCVASADRNKSRIAVTLAPESQYETLPMYDNIDSRMIYSNEHIGSIISPLKRVDFPTLLDDLDSPTIRPKKVKNESFVSGKMKQVYNTVLDLFEGMSIHDTRPDDIDQRLVAYRATNHDDKKKFPLFYYAKRNDLRHIESTLESLKKLSQDNAEVLKVR